MPSLDTGESGARARLAFRILGRGASESAATSLWQFACESRMTDYINGRVITPSFSHCVSAALPAVPFVRRRSLLVIRSR
jgi:hypothetical protein